MNDRVILHVDQNCFYASVEMLRRPELKKVPCAVAGDPANRHGIILAKNQLAKITGVKTGEAIWTAKEKCHDLVLVPPDYAYYLHYSRLASELYREYTDRVESFGIDECWLDLTGCRNDDGFAVAEKIRARVRHELGLTCSIGVSWNKVYAKLGSDLLKPDGTTHITRANAKSIVYPLPANALLYVGPATIRKLHRIGVKTIGELIALGPDYLQKRFGVVGLKLYHFAAGLDTTSVRMSGRESPVKSIGNSITTRHDLCTDEDIRAVIYMLSESVASRLRSANMAARTVQVSLRDDRFNHIERQAPLLHPTQLCTELAPQAFALIMANRSSGQRIRSLGVRAYKLIPVTRLRQQSYLLSEKKRDRLFDLEVTVDDLRKRYGGLSVRRGISMVDRTLTEHDIRSENVIHPVGMFGS
ncbi:MAG: DNA polymerase IV [Clostridiaceae bacterium]|jgi:DNA polymerase-4|nr:DNA polymerase IV [Clostridiaceae bacterium]